MIIDQIEEVIKRFDMLNNVLPAYIYLSPHYMNKMSLALVNSKRYNTFYIGSIPCQEDVSSTKGIEAVPHISSRAFPVWSDPDGAHAAIRTPIRVTPLVMPTLPYSIESEVLELVELYYNSNGQYPKEVRLSPQYDIELKIAMGNRYNNYICGIPLIVDCVILEIIAMGPKYQLSIDPVGGRTMNFLRNTMGGVLLYGKNTFSIMSSPPSPVKNKPTCECGATAANQPRHSNWCPLHS